MDIVSIEKRCECCLRHEATSLCDYEVGDWVGHPPNGVKSYKVTCDRRICEKCLTKINNLDICSVCFKKIKREVE